MAGHIHDGDHVTVVVLAEGITSRGPARECKGREGELSALAETARLANESLGVSELHLHDFPDNRMDGVELLDVVKCIESHISTCKPEIVYTHHAGDLNIDHQVVHNAVITACRPVPGNTVSTILFFEVPSSTEWQMPQSKYPFIPNWFVDISEKTETGISFLEMKLNALKMYDGEMRPWPHPRSFEAVESLARWRGASAGVKAAEAFVLGRHVP